MAVNCVDPQVTVSPVIRPGSRQSGEILDLIKVRQAVSANRPGEGTDQGPNGQLVDLLSKRMREDA